MKFFIKQKLFSGGNTISIKHVIDYGGMHRILPLVIFSLFLLPRIIANDHILQPDSIIYSLALLISIPISFKDLWPKKILRFRETYWSAGIISCLPLTSSYQLFEQNYSFTSCVIFLVTTILLAFYTTVINHLLSIIIGLVASLSVYIIIFQDFAPLPPTNLFISTFSHIIILTGIVAAQIAVMRDKIIKQLFDYKLRDRVKLEERINNQSQQLVINNATKNEFFNNISHEVRTPIHGITAISAGILERWDEYNDRERFVFITKIASNAGRIKDLVNNVLDISKIRQGLMNYDVKEHDFNDLIEQTIKESRNLYLLNSTLQICYVNNIGTCQLRIDHDRIVQVLRNLITNAIKFSHENTIINISLDSYNNECIIFGILNQGPHIPITELTQVFDAFVQSSLTDTGAGGSGLGLKICHDIINNHHGNIWAENTVDGVKISFTLPKINYNQNSITLQSNNMNVSKPKPKIAFIDDDEMMRLAIKMMLPDHDYEITTFDSGHSAIEYLTGHHKVDLILMDYVLGDMNGEALLNAIRVNHRLDQVPIIVQSGLVSNEKLANLTSIGFQGHLIKPYAKEEVVALIEKLLYK